MVGTCEGRVMDKANPVAEIEKFVSLLFEGEDKGYVYAPVKEATGVWRDVTFKWPSKRDDLVKHLLQESQKHDVYLAPAFFKAPNPKRQGFLHARFVWVEFDGNAPVKLPRDVPEPTIKVQSSVDKHEHWYWRLQEPIDNRETLEGLTRNLAYMLDADKSGWDANQVLRAPGTIHQDSGRRVKFLRADEQAYSLGAFSKIIVASYQELAMSKLQDLPVADEVIQKYKWPEDAISLFNRPEQPVGARSSAMTRLGFHCIEMGMTNEEAYVILLHADERWGKYKNRSAEDRQKRLLGIVLHCRSKKESEAEINLFEREKFTSLKDLRASKVTLDWLFKDLLPLKGLGTISARPGVGKSTLSLQLCISVTLGKDFLDWENQKRDGLNAGFLSLEMGREEVLDFLSLMSNNLSEAEDLQMSERLFLLPQGYAMALDDPKYQRAILDEIEDHNIQFLVIDSLKAATRLETEKLDKFYEWINKEVRSNRGVTVWIIHHNRKANKDQGPERDTDDLFGDTFIAAHPTTILVMTVMKDAKDFLLMHPVKIRSAPTQDTFPIRRTENLFFKRDTPPKGTTKTSSVANMFSRGIHESDN